MPLAIDLMKFMLQRDPGKRLQAWECLKHPFFHDSNCNLSPSPEHHALVHSNIQKLKMRAYSINSKGKSLILYRRPYDVEKLKKDKFARPNSPRNIGSSPKLRELQKLSSDRGSICEVDGFAMKKYNLMSGTAATANSQDLSPGFADSMAFLLKLSESIRGATGANPPDLPMEGGQAKQDEVREECTKDEFKQPHYREPRSSPKMPVGVFKKWHEDQKKDGRSTETMDESCHAEEDDSPRLSQKMKLLRFNTMT